MGFSKEQVRAAKAGTHDISFGPDRAPVQCTVSRVRDDIVRVRLPDGTEVRLNHEASRLLVAGRYRTGLTT